MTTHRLPNPGSDDGIWGDVLNDFLSQSLNGDGSLKASTIATKANTADLATVATSGSYTDLANKPTIPSSATFAPLASPALTGTPTINGTAAASRSGTRPVGQDELYVNVKDHGATGDGSTDDTSAIQAALNALPANGTLFFPYGTYLCASSLTVASYVTFQGAGKGSAITYSGTGTFITLTSQREVKWVGLKFTVTGTTGVLFNLSGCFRCSWHRCYLLGQYSGPANSGSYLSQIGVVLTANTGDCMFYDCDVTNFGTGLKIDCIQNGVQGGKFGTNNVDIYGFGGGGMSLTGYIDFVAAPANCDTHIKINGATGQWWLTDVWMEGCSTAIQIGSNTAGSVNGPSQFGMTNCKLAATSKVLDIRCADYTIITNVQLAGDTAGAATPVPVTLDTTNAPVGMFVGDSIISGMPISLTTFPIGWTAQTRSGGTSQFKGPNSLQLSYNASLSMARSDGAMITALQMASGPTLQLRGPASASTAIVRVLDTSNNAITEFDSVSSAVNYLTLTHAATTQNVKIGARGSDGNIGITLTPKGSGSLIGGTNTIDDGSGNSSFASLTARGITGSTAASRYVGATVSGAPASGAHLLGDWAVDQSGSIWICTTAGTPGTWTAVSGSGGGGSVTLDSTAADITATLGIAPVAGSTGKAADAGHQHPTYTWDPSDQGMGAWTYDPATTPGSSSLPALGTLQLMKVKVAKARSIASIYLNIQTTGTSLTNCYVALYTAAGSLLAQSADASSAFGTTGTKIIPLTAAQTVGVGYYYIGFWVNGSTAPAFLRTSGTTGSVNVVMTGQNLRSATADTGLTTTAPATFGTQSGSGVNYWWLAVV